MKNMMHDSIKISQSCHSHADIFNQSASSVKAHHISNTVLIFYNNKKTADKIANEILSSETKSETSNPCGRKKRANSDTHFLKNHQKGQEPNKHSERNGENANKSVFSLSLRFFIQKVIGDNNLSYELFNKNSGKFTDKISNNNDRGNFYAMIKKTMVLYYEQYLKV